MKLKIAITSTVSWPYVRRGSRITYELAVYLARQGHDVDYISIKPGEVSRKRMQDGVHAEYHRLIEHPLLTLCRIQKFDTFTLSCLGSLLKNDYDIVQTTFPMDAFAASIHKSIRGTPFVHYMFDRFYPRYYITRYGRLVFKRSVKTASRIGTISNFIRNDVKEKFGIEGVVIPGTVDVEQFTLCKDKDFSTPYILSTSSLQEPRKRIDLLVKAFDLLLDHMPNATLVLSGHTVPERTNALLESVSQRARKAIEIPGLGRREDLPGLYRNAAITVLPSINEACGLVILESLASGTPVVGTRSGGIPDILNDPKTGLMFEESDGPEEVCKALLKGMELSRDREAWLRCRQHAEQYSWSNVGPLYEKLYADVLDGASRKKHSFIRKKKAKNAAPVQTERFKGHVTNRPDSAALTVLFDDVLDELDIDYDSYYRLDLYKPLCTYILGWLFTHEMRKGNVLVINSYNRPLITVLESCGFAVKGVKIPERGETLIDSENEILRSDLNALANMSATYDVIICDDIIQHVENPGRLLQIVRDKLSSEGVLLLITENGTSGKARYDLFRGKNNHSDPDEHIPAKRTPKTNGREPAMCRRYVSREIVKLISESGFSISSNSYIIKHRAVKGSLFIPPFRPYVLNNLYHFIQKLFPALRSHIFIAAKRNSI